MLVACPDCRHPLEASKKHVGQVVRCGACGCEFEIAPPSAAESRREREHRRAKRLQALGVLVLLAMAAGIVVVARQRLAHPPALVPAVTREAEAPASEPVADAPQPTTSSAADPEPEIAPKVAAEKSATKREFVLDPAWSDLDFDGTFDEFWKKWGNRRLTDDEYSEAQREAEAVVAAARDKRRSTSADPFLARAEKRGENLKFHPSLAGGESIVRTEFRPWVLAVAAGGDAPDALAVGDVARHLVELVGAVREKFAQPLGLALGDEPLGVIVLRARPPYPPVAGGVHDDRRATYDASTSTLVVAVGDDAAPVFALHAAGHEMIALLGLHPHDWMVEEGLADYLAGLVDDVPAPLALLKKTWSASLTAPPWVPLPKLLPVREAADVAALAREVDPAHADRAVMLGHAEAWALVRHLLDGASGRYRDAFVKRLREPLGGNDLWKALAIKDPVLFDVECKQETLALARKH